MRILAFILLVLSYASFAEQETNTAPTEKPALSPIIIDGYLDEAQLKAQFEKVQATLDTSKPYKWEFRFTGNIMSSLETFAQLAHRLDFWPVALETDVSGDLYWLYIQKTHQYNQDDFIKEVSELFRMADYMKLRGFDGFSIDHPDTTPSVKEEKEAA